MNEDPTIMIAMKKMLFALLVAFVAMLPCPVLAEEKAESKLKLPTVEVYEIRKYEERAVRPKTILEITNSSEQTFYFRAQDVSWPFHDLEVKRGEKWLAYPAKPEEHYETYALRPGAKLLVTVLPSWDDVASRFRFFFYTKEDSMTGEVHSVWSRAIETKELGVREDVPRFHDREVTPEGAKEPLTDEALNKQLKEEWMKDQLKVRSGGSAEEPKVIEVK